MWKLKVKHPNGSTKIITGVNGDTTLSGLKSEVATLFSLDSSFEISIGHPPKKLVLNEGQPASHSLSSFGLKDSEVIMIVIPQPQQSPTPKKGSPTASSSSVAGNQQRRRGGKNEDDDESSDTSEFDESLLAEDDSEEENVISRRAKRAKSRPTTTTTSSENRPAAAASQRGGTQVRRTGIHTLHDTKRISRQPKKKIKSTEALGEVLAKSHGPASEAHDSVSKFFRRLTKGEVLKQYDTSKALARYTSALKREYEIIPAQAASSYRLGDGAALETSLTIRFDKGRRGFKKEETQQGLSEELLIATIRSVLSSPPSADPNDAFHHPREGLRPHMLCLVSPKVFWSLVHLKGGGPECIGKAFVSLLPDVDWTFLHTRVRRQTVRAQEWKQTETILDAFEQGGIAAAQAAQASMLQAADGDTSEDEDSSSGEDDDVGEIVGSTDEVKRLREAGIQTLMDLADLNHNDQRVSAEEDWISQAQDIVVGQLVDEILSCNLDHRASLDTLGVKTPADIARLRVPGRTEMVISDLQVTKETVDAWKSRAEELIKAHPWLDLHRTRG